MLGAYSWVVAKQAQFFSITSARHMMLFTRCVTLTNYVSEIAVMRPIRRFNDVDLFTNFKIDYLEF